MAIFRQPTQPQQPTPHVVQGAAAPAADDPPFGSRLRAAAYLAIVLTSWLPTPPQPQVRQPVPVEISAVPEDNPPFSHSSKQVQILTQILAQWQPEPATTWKERWSTRHLPLDVTAVPEDNPPFGIPPPSLAHITRAWQPGPPQPSRSGSLPVDITAVPENDPPFGLRHPLWPIIATWQPLPPLPWIGRYVPQEAVDNPPFGVPSPTLSGILTAWQPELPTTWQERWATRHLPVEVSAVPENNPPFSHLGRNPLSSILVLWQPDQGPQPQQGRHVPIDISAVPEDNPPFGVPSPSLAILLQAWQPEPPQPHQLPPYIVQEGVFVGDDPPFSHPTRQVHILAQILIQWQPDQGPQRQQRRSAPIVFGGTRLYLPASASPTAITPTPDIAWEVTSILARTKTSIYRSGDALATVSFADVDNTDRDILFRQFISAPLTPGQTITGSQALKLQVRVAERLAGNNLFLVAGIRVIAGDGTTVQKTVLVVTRDDVEATTALTNKQFTATSAITDYTTVQGDRLCIEIGMGGSPAQTGGADHDSDIRLGDAGTLDLIEDDSATADNNPWIQFTDLLSFEENDPPFGLKQPLWPILDTWQPFPPTTWIERWATRHLPVEITAVLAPEDPPFSHRGRDPLPNILILWQPDQGPQQQQGRHVPVEVSAVPEDNPPFPGPLRPVDLSTLLQTWQPIPPATWIERWATRHLPLAITAVPEDNPPFGIPPPSLPHILRAWQPGPPAPQRSGALPASLTAVPEENPPFGYRDPLPVILAQWIPTATVSQARQLLPQPEIAVEEHVPVPFPSLAHIFQAWQLEPPTSWGERWATRHLPIDITAVAAPDDPPFSHQGRDSFSSILTQWQPVVTALSRQRFLPQAEVGQPPRNVSPQLASILRAWQLTSPPPQQMRPMVRVLAHAIITGTITGNVTETDIVTGGKTLLITLTGDTWIVAGAGSFDLQRAAILQGLDSAQSEALGWNLIVRDTEPVSSVIRTSDTVVTIIFVAHGTYQITVPETITVTVPGSAVVGGVALVATPSFVVSTVGGTMGSYRPVYRGRRR